MVDGIRQIARFCGYAIGEHGSRVRDLDLIAVPWVDWAIGPELLVDALINGLELHITSAADPEAKPHGRLGWILVAFPWYREGDDFSPARHIDLSVLPRAA